MEKDSGDQATEEKAEIFLPQSLVLTPNESIIAIVKIL
jgi:hypothetical protein